MEKSRLSAIVKKAQDIKKIAEQTRLSPSQKQSILDLCEQTIQKVTEVWKKSEITEQEVTSLKDFERKLNRSSDDVRLSTNSYTELEKEPRTYHRV